MKLRQDGSGVADGMILIQALDFGRSWWRPLTPRHVPPRAPVRICGPIRCWDGSLQGQAIQPRPATVAPAGRYSQPTKPA
jgi:hypothetical protein